MARHADAASTSPCQADRLEEAKLPPRLVRGLRRLPADLPFARRDPARRHAKLERCACSKLRRSRQSSGKYSPLRRASQERSIAVRSSIAMVVAS
jgi:hypothetical protein